MAWKRRNSFLCLPYIQTDLHSRAICPDMFEFNNTVTLEFIGRNLLVPKTDKLPEGISVPAAKLYSE